MSECDSLDIHGIGKIQDFGFLVALNKMTMSVSHVSVNICDLKFSTLGDPSKFIGSSKSHCFCPEAVDVMEDMVERYTSKPHKTRASGLPVDSYVNYEGDSYVFVLDESASQFIFEIHRDTPPDYDIVSLYAEVIKTIMESTSNHELFDESCRFIAEQAGYDRAMVYTFSEDMSGEVVYEWIDPSMYDSIEPYIGMRFPESDIPLPARMMYTLKPVRVIHDTSSKNVEVIGTSSLNLSRCVTRASHAVHTQYMKNMGVRSSLSLGILQGEDLWGLLSFHDYEKPVVPRNAFIRLVESICLPFSTVLENITRGDHIIREETLTSVLDKLFEYKYLKTYIADNYKELQRITNTDCIFIREGESTESWGDTELASWSDDLSQLENKKVTTECYIGRIKGPVRGVIYIPHGTTRVVFYQKPVVADTVWGGDPNHVKVKRPDGIPGPRGSFGRYLLQDDTVLKSWTFQEKKLIRSMSARFHVFLSMTRRINTLTPNVLRGSDVVCNSLGIKEADSFLLTHMSHELLTPLAGISNSIRIVMSDKNISREDTESFLGDGMDCVESMRSTIQGIVSTPGIEGRPERAGKPDISSVEIIVLSVTEKYSPIMKTSGIRFSSENTVGADHGTIGSGYSTTITRSLFSVLENAIRFTEEGGSISLSVSVHSTNRAAVLEWKNFTSGYDHRNITNVDKSCADRDSKLWYTFTVKDTGCGVHPDMMKGVVSTINPAPDIVAGIIVNSHQGVGIGVYRGMIDILRIDGTVAMASSVGTGSSVSFIVPLTREEPLPKLNTLADISAARDGVFFVVDDSKINRKMTTRLLKMACNKSLGFEPKIKEFSDGRVCMEEVLKMQIIGEKPLCIIMDYHMPVMSGKEATEMIRQAEVEKGLEEILIVGYTADVTERTKQDLLSSGMNRILSKPISIDLLEELCNRVVVQR